MGRLRVAVTADCDTLTPEPNREESAIETQLGRITDLASRYRQHRKAGDSEVQAGLRRIPPYPVKC